MPLHVNLYHEVQRQELARQRDPLRLGMLGILVIALGFVANYFIVLEESHEINIRYSALQDDWNKIAPKAKAAKDRQDELNAEIQASDVMVKNVNSRLFWAPILGQVLRTVPREVQLTHISTQLPGDDKSLYSTITLSGISSAAEPRREAEYVRTALDAKLGTLFESVSSAFQDLDDSDQFVILDGRRLATATFTMQFLIQTRDPVVVAAPVEHHRTATTDAE
ncbi:MAG: hypothetical protein ABSE62_09375 [Chthoniobacteraceae bacterium]|jgi:Tfp pilus assembly protein PilN